MSKTTSKRTAGKAGTAATSRTPGAPRARKRGATAKTISAEERYRMVQEAAYYRAQKSGFSGDSVRHWLDAEREVAELLKKP